MHVLLLSTYELGHQPLGLARPAAHLAAAGHAVTCADLAVEHLPEDAVRGAGLVGISVPMHTATRLGVRLAERVRRLNPRAHLSFYGLYASLNADGLLGRYADSVVGGEFETPLVALADQLAAGGVADAIAGVQTWKDTAPVEAFLGRQTFALPRRDLLPPLERYARLHDGTREKLAGYVEATRGCAHRCLHCPITPVYRGRLRLVQPEVVLEDVRRLVALGAEHVTFGDPDFFNGIRHARRIVEALHAEHPRLTYDVTIKVEHLLEHRAWLPLLKETGCAFVVSAVEALDDRVLAHLAKGHSAADVETALGLMDQAGLALRPTFVAFTPWTSLESYLGLLRFLETRRLIHHVDPIQLAIRLLVPRGSSLLGTPGLQPHLGPFDEATFTYAWRHPDPRLDTLQRRVAAIVEQAAREQEDPAQSAVATFARVKGLALAARAGLDDGPPAEVDPRAVHAAPVPRLTEPWFC